MIATFSPAALRGFAQAPASKSEAHRRMICAGLSREPVTLTGFMDSADMAATGRCLKALGAAPRLDLAAGTLDIQGFAERPALLPVFDCGESGSTLRFFVPIALALTHGGTFRMHGRLGQRPMDVYRDLFVPRGVMWHMGEGADNTAELTVTGSLVPGGYTLPGDVSSQFVSGLLFALPLLQGESTLTVLPPVESAGYIRMTLQAIRDAGITVEEVSPFSWRVPGFQSYHARSGALHGDWSQATVLLCADALGAEISVSGLNPDSVQGDRAILTHLQSFGAEVSLNDGLYTVQTQPLHGTVLDLHDCPDIAPMLALVAQLAEGESRLSGCGRLRLKECDRLAATIAMLNALGGCAREEGDDMVIRGVPSLKGNVELNSCNDHRMVMLASIAALRADGPVTVTDVQALNKSWPGYPELYRSLGGQMV